jgi:hypothetical protein
LLAYIINAFNGSASSPKHLSLKQNDPKGFPLGLAKDRFAGNSDSGHHHFELSVDRVTALCVPLASEM